MNKWKIKWLCQDKERPECNNRSSKWLTCPQFGSAALIGCVYTTLGGTVQQHRGAALSLSPLIVTTSDTPRVTRASSPVSWQLDTAIILREKIAGFRSKLFHSNKCSVKCIRQQKWKQAFSVCFFSSKRPLKNTYIVLLLLRLKTLSGISK